mgnify:CR=1 FL=1
MLNNKDIKGENERIKKHVALEDELKKCRTEVKELERHKAFLVEEARAKITIEIAKNLIIKRWERTLHNVITGYQEIHTRQLIEVIEELYEKYKYHPELAGQLETDIKGLKKNMENDQYLPSQRWFI